MLVAGMVAAHPRHEFARPWLKRARLGQLDGIVTAHSLAETYHVMTMLPGPLRLTPPAAWSLIRENVRAPLRVVSLTPAEYTAALARTAELGLSGGVVFDALHAAVARKGTGPPAGDAQSRRLSARLA
jgi:predicted nucleic acid-binding protein